MTRASTSRSWQSGCNTPSSWSEQFFIRGAVLTEVLTTSSVQILSLEPPVFIATGSHKWKFVLRLISVCHHGCYGTLHLLEYLYPQKNIFSLFFHPWFAIEKDGDQFKKKKKSSQTVPMCSLVYEGAIRVIDWVVSKHPCSLSIVSLAHCLMPLTTFSQQVGILVQAAAPNGGRVTDFYAVGKEPHH